MLYIIDYPVMFYQVQWKGKFSYPIRLEFDNGIHAGTGVSYAYYEKISTNISIQLGKRKEEMFYLTTHSTHFI